MIAIKEILEFLGNEVIEVNGNPEGVFIKHLRPSESVDEDTLDWINHEKSNKQQIAQTSCATVILCDPEMNAIENKVLIKVANPKMALAKITSRFFVTKKKPGIHPSAIVDPEAQIAPSVFVGPNCTIGKCSIGENSVLFGNVYIEDHVKIGKNVSIQPGVVVGNEGHNYIRDNNNECVNFPHIGGVVIEDDVEIGGNSFVSRGVLSNTLIGKGTKIAQLVYVGANVQIGKHCAVRPNVMISGSVVVGDYSILAPTVTLRDQAKIGSNVTVGMGSVVTKNIPNGETWFGNPARKKE